MAIMFARVLCVLGLLLSAASAQAAIVTLDFEGIVPEYPFNSGARVLGFYNGGASSLGTSGPNLGVGFSSSAAVICLNTAGIECSNSSRGDAGAIGSRQAAMYFLNGQNTYLNVDTGFADRFAFNYAAPFQSGSVTVYSGLNGTGTALATLALPNTPSACIDMGQYCPFLEAGLSFAGTARSVAFGGAANQIVFDDIRFGAGRDGEVPAPATVMLFGLGLAALAAARSQLPRRARSRSASRFATAARSAGLMR